MGEKKRPREFRAPPNIVRSELVSEQAKAPKPPSLPPHHWNSVKACYREDFLDKSVSSAG